MIERDHTRGDDGAVGGGEGAGVAWAGGSEVKREVVMLDDCLELVQCRGAVQSHENEDV